MSIEDIWTYKCPLVKYSSKRYLKKSLDMKNHCKNLDVQRKMNESLYYQGLEFFWTFGHGHLHRKTPPVKIFFIQN
jgi:hypothetical protein